MSKPVPRRGFLVTALVAPLALIGLKWKCCEFEGPLQKYIYSPENPHFEWPESHEVEVGWWEDREWRTGREVMSLGPPMLIRSVR